MENEMTDVNGQGSETQPVADNNDFVVPEAYAEAGWAKNIHSYDDLWQQSANAQKLIGKKTIGIPTSDSSEAEIADFYSKLRPETPDSYELDLGDDTEYYKNAFYEAGLSPRQVNAVVNAYNEQIRQTTEGLYSKEGLENAFKEYIGNDFQPRVDEVTKFLKHYAKPSTLNLIDTAPNDMVGMLYGLISMTMDKYKVNELGAATPSKVSVQQDLEGYIKAKMELDLRPHSLDEEQELKRRYGVGNV
jgi:hypothetical protein